MRSLFCAALICAAFLAPRLHAAPVRDIVVGQIVDESGDNIDVGRDYVAGARVYFDFVNSQGGIAGRRLNLVVKDDGGVPERTVTAARELLEARGALLLFGTLGDASVSALSGGGDLKRWGVALFAPLAGADQESAADQVFFIRPTYRTEVQRIVDWFRGASLSRAAIVVGPGAFARESRAAALDYLKQGGITVAADIAVAGDGRDSAAAAARVAAAKPQFVLILADTLVAGQFIKVFRAMEPGVSMVGLSNVGHQTLLELVGPATAYGTLLTQVVPDPFRGASPLVREHLALMKRFRDEPPSHTTLEGFIAAKYLVATLRSIPGEIDRASILAALRSRREVDLGGFLVAWPGRSNRGSRYADMTLLRKDGSLLH
jgi:ABC-type branched-subunit amino acid transport system substrate-binding protein